jgi:hypothetical protein
MSAHTTPMPLQAHDNLPAGHRIGGPRVVQALLRGFGQQLAEHLQRRAAAEQAAPRAATAGTTPNTTKKGRP